MQEITLDEILTARETRVSQQKELLKKYKVSLVCFTLNIAGPVKTSRLIERAFFEGIEILESKLPQKYILYKKTDVAATGCTAFFCVSMDSVYLKEICTEIEDEIPLGRLFDMDVFNFDGKKLNRKNERGCIVCGASGRTCAAGRLHPIANIQKVTEKIITEHFLIKDSIKISALAHESLLKEVYATPKPGLVDKRNNGSHTDMDINTFITSANSLTPYFEKCVRIGHKTASQTPSVTFDLLKKEGILAEKEMYAATSGINTHKGAIYCFGVICGAIGRLWGPDAPFASTDEILSTCADILKDAIKSDFLFLDNTTAGGRAYLEHGITGIRGQAASGFKSVAKISLPVFKKALNAGLTENDALCAALIHLIATVKDTNLYNRGGQKGMQYACEYAKQLLQKNEFPKKQDIEHMDDAFICKNLSPGGCADLLAVTYFLANLK